MVYLDFALAVYAQRKSGPNNPYPLAHQPREEAWGLIKLLMGTNFSYVEADLQTLAFPGQLTIDTFESEMVRIYRCTALKWDRKYAEAQRLTDFMNDAPLIRHVCVELLAVHEGRVVAEDRRGFNSGVLSAPARIEVTI